MEQNNFGAIKRSTSNMSAKQDSVPQTKTTSDTVI